MHDIERKSFARAHLPWLIAGAALVLYLATLNHWLSLCSLGTAFTFTDPSARAPLIGPLHYLVTLPLRLLPTSIQLLGYNALSAVFAALTLALLARTVSLLPHDRTREERHRETDSYALLGGPRAWIPPLLAAAVCGLQFTFWQHATAATGEMLDLLLLAYVLRCLLEYRAGERERWLYQLSLVYGLATANNWAMIGFFPLILAAVLWLRGRAFFQARFFTRMTLLGCAGLLLYLLLPGIAAATPESTVSFWQALRFELGYQKNLLRSVPRLVALFGALTSLVPVILMSIRWPSTSGDTSAIGTLIAHNVFRFIYAILFLAGLWVALDAPFSTRVLLESLIERSQLTEVNLPFSFLSFHYLGALAIGYFVGYFLIVFGNPNERSRRRSRNQTSAMPAVALVCLLAAGVATAGALAWRNLPAIRASNGSILRQFAELALKPVPPQGALLLSDNPNTLVIVQTLLNERTSHTNVVTASSRQLEYAAYQRQLHERVPRLWPAVPAELKGTTTMHQNHLSALLAQVASSNAVFYLHYSFGYFFEASYLVPRGLAFTLSPYPDDPNASTTLPAERLDESVRFWSEVAPHLNEVAAAARRRVPDARMVSRWYASALNTCAVMLQRSGTNRLDQAASLLRLAQELNQNSLVIEVNLARNAMLRGDRPASNLSSSFNERFAQRYRGLNDALAQDGPIDDPFYCRELGSLCLKNNLLRQAVHEYRRAVSLDPGDLNNQLGLAHAYYSANLNDQATALLRTIRQRAATQPLTPEQEVLAVSVEAANLSATGNRAAAEALLLTKLKEKPEFQQLTGALLDFYDVTGDTAKAIAFIDRTLGTTKNPVPLLLARSRFLMKERNYPEASLTLTQLLARDPDNRDALLAQGALGIQTTNYTSSIAPLDRLLELDPDNRPARLNRAIALLQLGRLQDALEDYELLLPTSADFYPVQYGLGEIARQMNQNAKAIRHYQAYLRLAPPDSEESREVARRLQSLQAGKP